MREHGFSNMMGDSAAVQPGHMQEVMLHETAVAWIRCRLTKTTPSKSWLESRDAYEARLKRVVASINVELDVKGLCFKLPDRLGRLIAAGGGRLKERRCQRRQLC